MNGKVAFTVATLAAVCGMSQAIFTLGTGATAGTIALTTTTASGGTALTAAGALGLAGLAVVKLGALALLASRRGKRSAGLDNEDSLFAIAAQVEPAACYRRLICELATGKMPKSDNDVLLSLFNDETPIQSLKFEFATAAKVGKLVKDIETCEVRYSCPVSGKVMNDALLAQ